MIATKDTNLWLMITFSSHFHKKSTAIDKNHDFRPYKSNCPNKNLDNRLKQLYCMAFKNKNGYLIIAENTFVKILGFFVVEIFDDDCDNDSSL